MYRYYSARPLLSSPRSFFRDLLNELLTSRELAFRLAVRDIKAQYKQSFLGIASLFIVPLITAATWIYLSGVLFKSTSDGAPSTPVFVFFGTIIWSIFSDSVLLPINQINLNKTLLARVSFPREAIILSCFIQGIFGALVKSAILIALSLFLGQSFSLLSFIFVPVVILLLILPGSIIGIFVSPFSALYTDVAKLTPLILGIFMYLNPVVFAFPPGSSAYRLSLLNPIAYIINYSRDVFLMTAAFPSLQVVVSSLIFLLVFSVLWVFYRLSIVHVIARIPS